MTWNKRKSETLILKEIQTLLRVRLPETWVVGFREEVPGDGGVFDAVLDLGPAGGSQISVPVEVKARIEPRDVLAMVERITRRPRQEELPLVAAEYLSPRTRELLTENGLSYADTTGNVRLKTGKGAIFLLTEGASRDTSREKQSLQSLRGRIAGRVVRGLCDFKPPFGVRELAQLSKSSPAGVSRVVSLLDREALLERSGRGPIIKVDWEEILRRWATEYSWARSNRLSTWLAPRGLSQVLDDLGRLTETYAVTGSLAASKLAPAAAPRLASIYAKSASDLAAGLGLRAADAGINLVIAEPFDPVVFDRTWVRDGVTYAAPSQLAVDLMTGPGRSPAEGQALLRWMGENESAWRT